MGTLSIHFLRTSSIYLASVSLHVHALGSMTTVCKQKHALNFSQVAYQTAAIKKKLLFMIRKATNSTLFQTIKIILSRILKLRI